MILMSIRTGYAGQIFKGTKRVELRRRCPKASPGDSVAIYCPMPQMELVGIATIGHIVVEKPAVLWKSVQDVCGISKADYLNYFIGAKQAVGLFLHSPTLLSSPLPLSRLREAWTNFQPPQEFRYLDDEQERFVLEHMPARNRRRIAA